MFRHWVWSSKKPMRRADEQGRLKACQIQSGSSTRVEGGEGVGREGLRVFYIPGKP